MCLDGLARIFHRCIETNILLNFEKCHFMVDQGIVLAPIVSNRALL